MVEVRYTNEEPTYDASGLPSGSSTGILVATFEYDALNSLVTEDLPGGAQRRITRYRYDKAGNPVLILTPEWQGDPSEVVGQMFDERNLVFQRYSGGLPAVFRSSAAHDDIPELASVVNHQEMAETEVSYDAAGRVRVQLDGEQNPYESIYDGLGRPKEHRDPLLNKSTYSWDVASQLLEKRHLDANGALLAFGKYFYDELGRLYQADRSLFSIGEPLPTPEGILTPNDGFVTTRVKYDPSSNAISITDDNAVTTTFLYDALDRMQPFRASDTVLSSSGESGRSMLPSRS